MTSYQFTYHASQFFLNPPLVRDPVTVLSVTAERGGDAEAQALAMLPKGDWYLMLVEVIGLTEPEGDS